jgi:8-oxo-dGTP pyrophosphatase MutT (NUDIX family)
VGGILVIDPLDLDGANPWRTTSRRTVFDDGRLLMFEDSVVQPNGDAGTYTFLEVTMPIVAVVPIDEDGNTYLVRQWRYPWGRNSWEIPSGGGEAGEEPLAAARRELAEEVGLAAAQWDSLGGGFSSATIYGQWHFYLARGLQTTEAHQRDATEHDMIARQVPLTLAIDAALDGRIAHGMSALGLLRAARRLGI